MNSEYSRQPSPNTRPPMVTHHQNQQIQPSRLSSRMSPTTATSTLTQTQTPTEDGTVGGEGNKCHATATSYGSNITTAIPSPAYPSPNSIGGRRNDAEVVAAAAASVSSPSSPPTFASSSASVDAATTSTGNIKCTTFPFTSTSSASLFDKPFPSHPNSDDDIGHACCNPWSIRQILTGQKPQQQHHLPHTHHHTAVQESHLLEKEIAEEMQNSSFEQREHASNDVHGVSEFAKQEDDDPQFVDTCLAQLDEYIQKKIPLKDKRQLAKAFFLRPKYEIDASFKLKFIRAEVYDIPKAAQRMCQYFEEKVKLFGQDKLVKPITLDDLSPSEICVIKSGNFVELPIRDQIGRPIILIDQSKVDWSVMESENMFRSFWYLIHSLIDDEIGQKKGLSAILYLSGEPSQSSQQQDSGGTIGKNARHTLKSGAITAALPFRLSSIHFCYDDSRMDVLLRALRMAQPLYFRLRVRSHFGSEMEIEYKLRTYGIQASGLLQGAKVGKCPVLNQYLERRFAIDRKYRTDSEEEVIVGSSDRIIEYPQPNDVLIGRGAPYREFPGTMLWDKLILQNVQSYMKSTNFEKTCLSMDMVRKIKDSGGRFLLRQPAAQGGAASSASLSSWSSPAGIYGWKILNDNTAREKAAIAFRSRSKTFVANSNKKGVNVVPNTTQSSWSKTKR